VSFTSAESSGQAMAEGGVPRALEQGADRGVGGVLSPTKGILPLVSFQVARVRCFRVICPSATGSAQEIRASYSSQVRM
jgi:hypothetical protein